MVYDQHKSHSLVNMVPTPCNRRIGRILGIGTNKGKLPPSWNAMQRLLLWKEPDSGRTLEHSPLHLCSTFSLPSKGEHGPSPGLLETFSRFYRTLQGLEGMRL